MTAGGTAFTWKKVFAALLESEPDAVAKVDVWDILHPLEAGMQRVRRQATGQIADYLLPVNSDKLCHVRDCGDLYEVRLYDVPQPQQLVAERPIKTTVLPARPVETRSLADLPAVAPGLSLLLTTGLGALIGAAFGGAKGAAAGALIGGGAGLAAVAVSSATSAPHTSIAAQGMFMGLAGAGLSGHGAAKVLRFSESQRRALPALESGDTPARASLAKQRSTKK